MVKIRFKVDPDGEVKMEVEGASGGECLKMTQEFEALLGAVKSRDMKESFYEEEQNTSSEESNLR